MPPPCYDAAYYAENYREYSRHNPLRKLRHYARVIERCLGQEVPRRVHDIGCGWGHFLAALDSRWELYGSDTSSFAIAQAAQAVPRGRFAVWSAADIDALPFPGLFGVVTAFDVLEHIGDLKAVAESVKRQLLDEGLFVFVVPVYDGLSGPVIRWLDRDPTHVHKWPRARWLSWANSHFHVLKWSGTFRYLLPFRYYLHLPTVWFRKHAPAITVVCRKLKTVSVPETAGGGGASGTHGRQP